MAEQDGGGGTGEEKSMGTGKNKGCKYAQNRTRTPRAEKKKKLGQEGMKASDLGAEVSQ